MLYWCLADHFYHFRSRKQGEYSGLSNAEKCKLYRSKGSEQKKKNDALRKKLWHAKLKENLMKEEQYKVNNTANYKTKKTKQLKCKKLVNVLQVQTTHLTNSHELIERFSCNLQEIDCVLDRCPICCVAEIELQIQLSDSSDSVDENEIEQLIYFTWKKVDKRVTKAQRMVSFIDAVFTVKSQIKVLKEHTFVKKVQDYVYKKHR